MSPRSIKLALAACALTLIPAGLAQAATKTVDMGVPLANQKALQKYGADVNAFFPNDITVHRGDKINFVPTGFHSLEFPKKGSASLPLAGPSGQTIANYNDPGGTAYWFNGQADIEFLPAMVTQNWGKTFAYNGKTQVLSGLPLGEKLKPVTVKFTKTGTFTYYCNVHPGMKAKVHVVAPKAKSPSAKSDAKRVTKQVAAATKTAKALQNPTVGANDVSVGNSGAGGVEIFAFFPATKSVAVGTTLTFSMSPQSLDLHTATTGPGDPLADPNSFLGKMAGSIGGQPPFDQAGVYPSDAPPGPASLTPTTHGNGFWGTGFMDASAATPLPPSGQVKIDAPGTYNFYCLIHPFMHMTVTAS